MNRWLVPAVRIAGVAYIGFLLLSGAPLLFRLVLAATAATIVLTCHRWRAFALFASPFLIQLLIYDRQRVLSPAVTRRAIDVTGPRDWELAWFSVRTANGPITVAEWFQTHTTPILDFLCGIVYLGFMPGFVLLAAWWRFKERRTDAWVIMWALLALHVIGYTIHQLHPTAPPWYVTEYGTGPAVVTAPPEPAGGTRFDQLLGVSWFSGQYKASSSVFGALPSLHVGQTFLAALFATHYRSLRTVAWAFFALVLLASVYLNHHYLVDGLAGMAIAAVIFTATMAFTGWRPRLPWRAKRQDSPGGASVG
ncbi:phosphatase PAP2 family protein [Actinokineospora auranticolor]|uniref:PAP2 superfamily protein n=1 Tax=Actinokineospora auranticolor TaxID=155976 RepID=A0A2S6GHV8_9PSEU|nr:phosphatase PAP2 family protein [Actinokineospora auranticolor]PPK64814.1 PAP2 superfamily protein [Actinokineospora auranticolor]